MVVNAIRVYKEGHFDVESYLVGRCVLRGLEELDVQEPLDHEEELFRGRRDHCCAGTGASTDIPRSTIDVPADVRHILPSKCLSTTNITTRT